MIHNERGGVALILVVWIIVVLIAIAGEFSYSMRTEVNIARNFKEEEQTYQLALAGIEKAKFEILSVKAPAITYLNDENILMFGDDEEEAPVRDEKLGNGGFSYIITDEDGKMNINTESLERLKYLLIETGIDVTEVDTIADSIIDWRDPNDLHMLNGAEEDYYRALEEPYSCKDGPFDSLEELLLVRGVTEEFFKGSKSAEEEDDDEEKEYQGLEQYLTVYGSGRININTAPGIVLEAVLGTEAANNIIMQRETAPIARPISNGKVSSEFFTIISTGSTEDGTIKRTIKTVVRKKERDLEIIYWNDNIIG